MKMYLFVTVAFGLASVVCARPAAGAVLRPADVWAGRPSHPAVVHPVALEKFGRGPENVSLAGDWDFVKFNHASGVRTVRWYKDIWAKDGVKVAVPGCWQAGGVGEQKMSTPHLCADNSPKEIRHSHIGEGWYRRYVTIPADWAGRRIWIKVGGILAQGWIFVNDRAVCMVDDSMSVLKWEITDLVTPGKEAKIVVMADNKVGHRGGPSGSLERWGGIWRDIELEATPQTFIDDVWVRGDFDGRKAVAEVTVAGGEKKVGQESRSTKDGRLVLRMTVEDEKTEITLSTINAQSSTFNLNLPLRQFRPWSPEEPNLYWAKIELLEGDKVVQTVHRRFGVRKIEARGKELYLNDKPFFVRGFGDNPQYPLTGVTPCDWKLYRERLGKARACGFNFIRHHTHTESPEYMEAADECGLIVQPEIPYYCDNPNDYFSYDPLRDAEALVRTMRHYPSFGVLSFGNEGLLGPGANKIVYDFLKKFDPDILVLAQDGGTYLCDNGAGCSDYCSGPLATWARGTFNPPRPFVCHEYMNLAAKFDWRDEADYTGLWLPPMTAASRQKYLTHTGLSLAWLARLQDAGHDLQKFWQKNGIESARADPYCDGYVYWTIADSSVFNEDAGTFVGQGLFTPFWKTKRHGLTPEELAVFNSRSCLLIDTTTAVRDMTPNTNELLLCSSYLQTFEETNRVYTVGETIPAKFLLAHFGDAPIKGAVLDWKFNSADGVLASGEKSVGDQPLGGARLIADCPLAVPAVAKPTKATLAVSLRGTKIANSWDFWFFPKAARPSVPANVVVAAWGSSEAEAARKAGKNLVTLANQSGAPNFVMGWWSIGKQAGTAILPHACFGDFPYEPYLSPLLFDIVKEGTKLPVAGFEEKDYVIVGEGQKDAYLYLAAKVRSDGSREVFVSGLDLTDPSPAGDSLYANLLRWAAAGK